MDKLRLQGTGSDGCLTLQASAKPTTREALSLQAIGSVGVLKIQPYIVEKGHRILSLASPVYFNGDYLLIGWTTKIERKVMGVPDPARNILSGKRV